MTALRVAFAGLAHSHPYTDAAGARRRGFTITGITDRDAVQRAEFAERFGCPERPSVEELTADAPDVVIVTPHSDQAVEYAVALGAAGVPAFFNKCVAATEDQLRAFDYAVGRSQIGTSSVLRFAPAVEALARRLDTASVLSVGVTVQHDNTLFTRPERRWQDDPTRGGGTLVTVGIHAWEMIDALLPGAELELAGGWTRRRSSSPTQSEDVAGVYGDLMLDGRRVPVHAHIGGVPGPDLYEVELLTETGIERIELDTAEPLRGLGFDGMLEALSRRAVRGQVPAPWATARTVVANTIRAAVGVRSTFTEG